MNTQYIRYNLQDAEEEIENIMEGLEQGKRYTHADFYSSMQHLIHHINIAWNARSVSDAQAENATDEDLKNWGKFPTDITLL